MAFWRQILSPPSPTLSGVGCGTGPTSDMPDELVQVLQTGHWFFSCLWTQTETLGLEAVDFQTRNIPLTLLGHGLWIGTKSSALLDPASYSP